MNPTRLIRTHSEEIFTGKAFRVSQDEFLFPNGMTHVYDIVRHKGAVTILPIDEKGMIWFVRQFRPAADELVLELPAGTLESDEDPLECAKRELREEIGMGARQMDKIGEFFMAPGYSTELMHVFLATDLYPDVLQGDADEILSIESISLNEVLGQCEGMQFRDSKTLATLFLAMPYFNVLRKKDDE